MPSLCESLDVERISAATSGVIFREVIDACPGKTAIAATYSFADGSSHRFQQSQQGCTSRHYIEDGASITLLAQPLKTRRLV